MRTRTLTHSIGLKNFLIKVSDEIVCLNLKCFSPVEMVYVSPNQCRFNKISLKYINTSFNNGLIESFLFY